MIPAAIRRIFSGCLMCAVFTHAFKFPSDIERCKYSDSRCLSRVVTQIARTHYMGYRALNLIPFDPVHIESLVWERSPGGLLDAEIKFRNIDLIGLSSVTVYNVSGFTKEASNLVFMLDQQFPKIVMTGPYSIEGYIFNIPVNGHGNSKITFDGLKVIMKVKCTVRETNGRKYLHTDEVELDMQPQKMTFAFENLSGCDKAQGDRVNQLLNQNWKCVFSELRPWFEKNFAKIGLNITKGPFAAFPYADLFLKS